MSDSPADGIDMAKLRLKRIIGVEIYLIVGSIGIIWRGNGRFRCRCNRLLLLFWLLLLLGCCSGGSGELGGFRRNGGGLRGIQEDGGRSGENK
jgi:hypothetical protein